MLLNLECPHITSQLKREDLAISLEKKGNASYVKTTKLVMDFTISFNVHIANYNKLDQILITSSLNTNSYFSLFNNKSLFHYIATM